MTPPRVVPRLFGCKSCGTIWHCNRAEPDCAIEHPGQWHVQAIDFPDQPCATCATWVDPWKALEAAYLIADAEHDLGIDTAAPSVLMYPTPPIRSVTVDALWGAQTDAALALRGRASA